MDMKRKSPKFDVCLSGRPGLVSSWPGTCSLVDWGHCDRTCSFQNVSISGLLCVSYFSSIVWLPICMFCVVVWDTSMQVILSSPYGPQVFYFLLWLIDFKAKCKGHHGFLGFPWKGKAWWFPCSPFISMFRLPCKSHCRYIGIYVIF